jgi:repressor LexA
MKRDSLHSTQKKLLTLLKRNQDEAVTIREMQEFLGASSTSVVAHHLTQLEKKGYLKRNPSNPRDYQVLADTPERQVAYLNLYGLAHCGPSGSILDGTPIDRIRISSRLLTFPASEGFLVKAKGDSMAPKINNGDLIIAQKMESAENGKIIVCVNDGETLIKKLQREKRGNILVSLNHAYPTFLASKDFRVVGEVRGVLSYTVD